MLDKAQYPELYDDSLQFGDLLLPLVDLDDERIDYGEEDSQAASDQHLKASVERVISRHRESHPSGITLLSYLYNAQKPPVLIDAGTSGLSASLVVYNDPGLAGLCCRRAAEDAPLPVCTLRSRPTQPRHCAAFARFLAERVLGGVDNELVEVRPVDGLPAPEQYTRELLSLLLSGADDERQLLPSQDGRYASPGFLDGVSLHEEWDHQTCVDVVYALLSVGQPRGVYRLRAARPYAYEKDAIATQLFVGAVHTLRCRRFGVAPGTPFQASALAGRIVPALGFANALVAAAAARCAARPPAHDMLLVSRRAPYARADANEPAAAPCDFCGAELGAAGRGALCGAVCALDGALAGDDDEESAGWFGGAETRGAYAGVRRGALYIQSTRGTRRLVLVTGGCAGYRAVRGARSAEDATESCGSSVDTV